MELKLPPEVGVIDLWPSSIRFVLPPRRLARGRIVVGILLVLGLLLVAMLASAVLSFFKLAPWVFGKFLGPLPLLLLIPTLGGIIPLWWGAVGLWGHRELEIRGQWLRTIERLGPFWRSKRWKLAQITHFEVVAVVPPHKGQPTPKIFEMFNALLVKFAGGQGMLAWGYTDELLKAVAAALADRGNAALEREGLKERIDVPGKVAAKRAKDDDLDDEDLEDDEDIEDEDDEDVEDTSPRQQPAGSKIEIERFEGGLSIKVPAAGLWKGTSGLFFFSLIWNGFMTMFTSLALFGLSQGKAKGEDLWIMIPFCGLFWLIGIGLLLGSLSMGRRRAGLAVAEGSLMVLQTGLFRSKQHEWTADDLAAIRLGPSGMEVNDVPVMELHILSKDGKKTGLLCGRTNAELEWIAWELRQVLNVPEYGDEKV